MKPDEINYKTLRKIQESEKKFPMLSSIDKNFYISLSAYLDNLKKRMRNESSSQKRLLLEDEINNTIRIITSIYEYREKKILLATISKSRSGKPNIKNLVDVEKNLFDSIFRLTSQMRKNILNVDFGEISEEGNKVNRKNEEDGSDIIVNSKSIVRVIHNMPKFIGTDTKEYNLREGDVLSLPKDMIDMLSKRGIVKKLK